MSARGTPFKPGNKFGRGRPKGSRNKFSLAGQRLLEEHGEVLARHCLAMALRGKMPAMRMAIDRAVPLHREQFVKLKLPPIKTAADVAKAQDIVLQAVARGKLTPADGIRYISMLGERRQAIDTEELEARLEALESKADLGPPPLVTRRRSK